MKVRAFLLCVPLVSFVGCGGELEPGVENSDPEHSLNVFGGMNSKHLDGTLHVVEFRGHKFAIWSGDNGAAMLEIHDIQK